MNNKSHIPLDEDQHSNPSTAAKVLQATDS
jgi:hypothetical protein